MERIWKISHYQSCFEVPLRYRILSSYKGSGTAIGAMIHISLYIIMIPVSAFRFLFNLIDAALLGPAQNSTIMLPQTLTSTFHFFPLSQYIPYISPIYPILRGFCVKSSLILGSGVQISVGYASGRTRVVYWGSLLDSTITSSTLGQARIL